MENEHKSMLCINSNSGLNVVWNNLLTGRQPILVLNRIVCAVVDEELSHLAASIVRHSKVQSGVAGRVSVIDLGSP